MRPGVKLPIYLFLLDFYIRFEAFLLGLNIAYGAFMFNIKVRDKRWLAFRYY